MKSSLKESLLRKFIRLSTEEKKLFAEAVFFIFFSKVFLLLPFRICLKQLRPAEEMDGRLSARSLQNIRNAVSRAGKLTFWENNCLPASLGGRFMLQRRRVGSVMYLGLQFKNGKELVAHAWLIADNIYVTPKGKTNYEEIFKV
ncbi:MAG: lasso peptide biosynthesis B2 protein [Mangrovibacterium sp.]